MTAEQEAPGGSGEPSSRLLNYNVTTAAALLVLSVALLLSVPYQVAKPKTVFGQSITGLDPALFPRLVLGTLALVSVWYLVRSLRLTERSLLATVGRQGWRNVGVTLLALLAYAVAMEPLGFVISSVLALGFLATFYGNRNFWLTVAVAVVVPMSVYHLFTRVLLVSLPGAPDF